MAGAQSLLSLIARGYAAGREDAATEALCFILSRSDSARDEFAKFVGGNGQPLPIARFRTQELVNGAFPDMACFDEDGNHVAFVESKFWASLTSNQPVTYWEALPDDRSATLLFLAPASRVARTGDGWLRAALVERLRLAGHDLTPAEWQEREDLVTTMSNDGQRRLMLSSWDALLDRLVQRTDKDGDSQARFEVTELRGLACDTSEDDAPDDYDNLKRLITDAVTRVKESGWANTDGLRTGGSEGVFWVRYLRLGGAAAGLRIDFRAVKQMGQPLWLWFWDSRDTRKSVGLDEVRDKLGALAKPGFEWLPHEDICVPIDLPVGAGHKARLDALVDELERIAKIIDPYVPTYRRVNTTD